MSDEKMSKVSRRTFMKRSAVAGAGAVALSGIGGPSGAARALAAPTPSKDAEHGEAKPAEEPVVAYVRKGSSGEVRVMVGEREVVHRDRDLARRILRAAR